MHQTLKVKEERREPELEIEPEFELQLEREQEVPPLSSTNMEENSAASRGSNQCAGCWEPIRDKFIFSVIDLNWHQDCVQCADCLLKLNERCHTYDGKLYCRQDYWRRFGPKCFACKESIERNELVQIIKGNRIYHLKCFTCSECNKQLKAGEQLHLIDGKQLLCRQDYHNQIAAGCKSPANYSPSSNNHNNGHNHNHNHNHNNNSKSCFQSQATSLSSQQQQQQSQQHTISASTYYTLMSNQGNPKQGSEQKQVPEQQQQQQGSIRRAANNNDIKIERRQNASVSGDEADLVDMEGGVGGCFEEELDLKQLDCGADEIKETNGQRRGPRTTIKPDQLDTLKRAFAQTPKPSRHVREQLANETHLNMRVIQVWFQNRRSKERRMKNSNGNARRLLYRSSSSRRIRVGATPTANSKPASGGGQLTQQQQSLIAGAGGGPGANQRTTPVGGAQQQQLSSGAAMKQDHSPINPKDHQQQLQLLSGGGQQQASNTNNNNQRHQSHNSPSEFGGSSSGGFTYFSDSSNQGDAFAINTGTIPGQAQQQPQQQYLPANASMLGQEQPVQSTLITLELPSNGANSNNLNNQNPNGQQQQYQPMKGEPQPSQPIYQQQPPPPPPQQHMMMTTGAPGGGQMAGHRGAQQHHLNSASQIKPSDQGLGLNPGLGMTHPSQGAPVVQW